MNSKNVVLGLAVTRARRSSTPWLNPLSVKVATQTACKPEEDLKITMWSTQWIFVILGLLMVASNNAQVCSNDIPGVQKSEVCCVAECGTCGGSGCGSRSDLTADDCCLGRIRNANVFCDDSGTAPCLISSEETCSSNGLHGIEAHGVCCVAECPKCGGSRCGRKARRHGLTSGDCCSEAITSAGISCNDSGMAPCVIDIDKVCGPALTITLEWSESLNDLDLAVTEPDGTLVRYSNMAGSAGFLDMDVRSGPGVEIYTIFSGLDTDSVNVLGDYKIQVRRFSGPLDTTWILVATLVEKMILTKIGNFTESSNSEFFIVPVTDYDPSCEGNEPFVSGSRDSTSSPEDKLP